MSNNSLAMTSALVKKLFIVENVSVSPFCTKLSQRVSFFLKVSTLFIITKIFVQILYFKLVQMAKYICQIRKLTHHIRPKEILLMESSFLSKTVLFLPWPQQDAKELLFDSNLTSAWRKGSCFENILSFHTVFQSGVESRVDLEFHWQFSLHYLAHFQISSLLSLQLNAPDGLCNE